MSHKEPDPERVQELRDERDEMLKKVFVVTEANCLWEMTKEQWRELLRPMADMGPRCIDSDDLKRVGAKWLGWLRFDARKPVGRDKVLSELGRLWVEMDGRAKP